MVASAGAGPPPQRQAVCSVPLQYAVTSGSINCEVCSLHMSHLRSNSKITVQLLSVLPQLGHCMCNLVATSKSYSKLYVISKSLMVFHPFGKIWPGTTGSEWRQEPLKRWKAVTLSSLVLIPGKTTEASLSDMTFQIICTQPAWGPDRKLLWSRTRSVSIVLLLRSSPISASQTLRWGVWMKWITM